MSTGLALITIGHVAISLLAIGAGAVVTWGLLAGKRLDGWTGFFLVTTVLTSATGYLFPVDRLLPSHVIGAISLAVLAVAIYALYGRQLAGGWRQVYLVSALVAFYLNVFVLVVQSFLKIPPLKSLAPTQTEAPFAIAQLVVLVAFIGIGVLAWKRFRADAVTTA